VDRFPEQGSFVLLGNATVEPGGSNAPFLVDLDTGATHRLKALDATCDAIGNYESGGDSGRRLIQISNGVGVSPARHLLFATPRDPSDVPLLSLALDGRCAPRWHEPNEYSTNVSVSADGTTVLRWQRGFELRRDDGSDRRPLAWLDDPHPSPDRRDVIGESVKLSPRADRIALVRYVGYSGSVEEPLSVQVCDPAGACREVHGVERANFAGLGWSPDGARLALLASHDERNSLTIIDVASRATVVLSPGTRRSGIRDFAWSPDGQRLALLSAHEGGCTPPVRDMVSTCHEGVYVVDASGEQLRTVRRGIDDAWGFWWLR
jgi:hypothetical protein